MGQQISSALRQSMHRVVLVLANFLPGIMAFLLAVIFFSLLGWGLSALLKERASHWRSTLDAEFL